MSMNSPYDADWWDYIMEYIKDINALLGSQRSAIPVIEDPKSVINKGEEPTSLKAAWELLEMFYAKNPSHSWLPERLVDWIMIAFSREHTQQCTQSLLIFKKTL